jgi:hypothetical protein
MLTNLKHGNKRDMRSLVLQLHYIDRVRSTIVDSLPNFVTNGVFSPDKTETDLGTVELLLFEYEYDYLAADELDHLQRWNMMEVQVCFTILFAMVGTTLN